MGDRSYEENNLRINYSGWRKARSDRVSGGAYRTSTSQTSPAQGAYVFRMGASVGQISLITAKGPTRGKALMELYEQYDAVPLATKVVNLYARRTQWQAPVAMSVPSPQPSAVRGQALRF